MEKAYDYEKQLSFNSITKWLHSHRYHHALKELSKLKQPFNLLEIGCAEAKLFGLVNSQFRCTYTGIEISAQPVNTARKRYGHEPNFTVLQQSATDLSGLNADVVVAMETLEHIPGNAVVQILDAIANLRPKLFICSVPIEVGPAIWFKNVGSFLCGYNRHLEYTWPETLNAGLYRMHAVPPHTNSHKGFDWRWLVHTIHQRMQIDTITNLPLPWLPASLSTSIFVTATPRHM